MVSPTLPSRDRFYGVLACYYGSYCGVFIRRECFLRLSAGERYLIDTPAADHFLSDTGDYCRIYVVEHWQDVCDYLRRFETDPDQVLFDCWLQYDEDYHLPLAWRLPHPMAFPHRADLPRLHDDDLGDDPDLSHPDIVFGEGPNAA